MKKQEKFAAALVGVLKEFGAREPAPEEVFSGYSLVLQTRAGLLHLVVHGNHIDKCASVYARFRDVDEARRIIGPHSYLNTYSGKWNHHFFDCSIDDAVRVLRGELSKVVAK